MLSHYNELQCVGWLDVGIVGEQSFGQDTVDLFKDLALRVM